MERPISSPYNGIYGRSKAIKKDKMKASIITRRTSFFNYLTEEPIKNGGHIIYGIKKRWVFNIPIVFSQEST